MKGLLRRGLGICSILFVSATAWGWGSLGHRTTGAIADSFLSPQARTAVQQLLRGQSLADVAFWADTIKSDNALAHTYWYHFENVADTTNFLDHVGRLSEPDRKKGGSISAIIIAERTLQDPKTTYEQKQVALKLLVHFIGDLHQPFHTGRADDKGGNTIRLVWFNRPGNLHQVWDTGMIFTGHGEIFEGQPQNADYAALYARWLLQNFRGRESDVLKGPTRDNPEAWLRESQGPQRQLMYDRRYETNQSQYQDRALPVLDQRVYAAGVRIADVLNRIFANAAPPNMQLEFVKRLEMIVGRLADFITAGPRANQGERRERYLEY
ncbi:MAG: S1/P1 nuclease [Bdellovibrionaceae bacterium]|nr:S1/P1 nuclease [Pseudobdellovibrionaceae bacterium]MBX3033035.1 S1/P1 nuclease [Pseudobdellovibrionaceae bacterium]